VWGSEEFPASYEAEGSLVGSECPATLPCPQPHLSFHTLVVFFNTEFGAIEAEIMGFEKIVLS